MNKIIGKLKELHAKQKRKRELREMDRMWDLFFGYCFDAFPPSVRLTYTREEIKNKTRNGRGELQSMMKNYAQNNGVVMK